MGQSKDLVTVFEGSYAEAYVLQVILQARGFYTHLSNQIIKIIDPFITGVGMFRLSLQVPQDQAEEAGRALRDIKASGLSHLGEEEVQENPEHSLERLGRSLRWGAILCASLVALPFVGWIPVLVFAIFFIRYMAASVKLAENPPAHVLTLLSGILIFSQSLIQFCIFIACL